MKDTFEADRVACDFCDEFLGGTQNAYAHRYGSSVANRELLNDGVFRILPTLGQLTQGHLLIIPIRHMTSMAALLSNETDRLETICDSVRSTLEATYGQAIFFEHGIQEFDSGGCGIDHAHMHAVPVVADGVAKILAREFIGHTIRDFGKIKSAAKGTSYLFYEDSSSRRYVFHVNKLPSQYMGKLIAECIGKHDWDWRVCGQERELITTLERLIPLFSSAVTGVGE